MLVELRFIRHVVELARHGNYGAARRTRST